MLPGVSIILPTYQGATWLADTLPAIRAQTYRGPVELVAVDSESNDGTPDLLRRYGAQVISIRQRDFGHGRTRNFAAGHARFDRLVFMSQDALPVGTDWLRSLIDGLEQPGIGATYARQVARPGATPLETFFHLELYPPISAIYALQPGQPTPLDRIFFSNVCSATHRAVWESHPFDEDLIMSEDQAFSKALLRAGYRILYNAEACVLHSHRYSAWLLLRRNFDSAYSLRGISDDTWLRTARRALNYVGKEIRYLIRERRWRWLLAMPSHEVARIAGRMLGSHADRLPVRWRVFFSLHRTYWNNAAH